MAISNLVLTQQSYSEEKNGAHAHYREPVPLSYHMVSHNLPLWNLDVSRGLASTQRRRNETSILCVIELLAVLPKSGYLISFYLVVE